MTSQQIVHRMTRGCTAECGKLWEHCVISQPVAAKAASTQESGTARSTSVMLLLASVLILCLQRSEIESGQHKQNKERIKMIGENAEILKILNKQVLERTRQGDLQGPQYQEFLDQYILEAANKMTQPQLSSVFVSVLWTQIPGLIQVICSPFGCVEGRIWDLKMHKPSRCLTEKQRLIFSKYAVNIKGRSQKVCGI